jgi:hypothetical protein
LPNASGLSVPYYHSHGEAAKASTQAPDLLGGASDVLAGTVQVMSSATSAVFGSQKQTSGARTREYIQFSNASGILVRIPAR